MDGLVLGLSVGLSCLASCGAVLLPWLVVQQRGGAATAWLLAQVLAGRLAGYMLFAVLAWAAGLVLVPSDLRSRALVFGVGHLGLAAVLGWYLVSSKARPRHCAPPGAPSRWQRWRARTARLGPAALGLLTGINICPPFVAAAIRAAELQSLGASVVFFGAFFVGTSVWFLPFMAASAARRVAEARAVARVAMGVVAAYYAYVGAVTLGWRLWHG